MRTFKGFLLGSIIAPYSIRVDTCTYAQPITYKSFMKELSRTSWLPQAHAEKMPSRLLFGIVNTACKNCFACLFQRFPKLQDQHVKKYNPFIRSSALCEHNIQNQLCAQEKN